MDWAEEVAGELVVAGGDAAVVPQMAEHAFDGVAPFVIGEPDGAWREIIEHHIGGATVGDLTTRQQEGERSASLSVGANNSCHTPLGVPRTNRL